MRHRPLILVTATTQQKGAELADLSTSVSEGYLRALMAAGEVPVVLSCTPDHRYLAEAVARSDAGIAEGIELGPANASRLPWCVSGLKSEVRSPKSEL
jgi:hypothetical protein